ncbi:MAG: hypothetical protein IKU07_02560 [Oscillospiraceae bacterium]|nr:hypothetical protein [Oscillospiraceae bacterium]
MKKRLIPLLIAFVLLLCVGIANVWAADVTENHVCEICGGSAVSWQPLPQITKDTTLATGHYYVPEGGLSNTAKYTFNNNGTRCIDLNGNNITSTTRVFYATNNARINIFGDGEVTGNTAGGAEQGSIASIATGRIYAYGGTFSSPTGTPFYLNKKDYAKLYLLRNVKIIGSSTAQESMAGAIHVVSGRLEMYGGTVTGGNGVDGGNIYVAEGRCYVDGTTITGGKATNGGNIYIKGGVDFQILKGTVTKGTATTSGGNIYIASGDAAPTCTMSGGTVSSGSAKNGGGIYITGLTANLSGTTFKSNSGTNGGTVYCATKGILNMTGGSLQSGSAKEKGGNAYTASTNAAINISGGTVTGGKAGTNGGNLYINNGNLKLTGGTVTDGSGVEGGNIYTRTGITSASNTSTIGGSGCPEISGGTASTNGGNVFVEGKATLANCNLINGAVPNRTYGTDLYCDKTASLTITPDYTGTCHAHIYSLHIYQARLDDNVISKSAVTCTGYIRGKLILDNYSQKPILHGNADGTVSIMGSGLVYEDGSTVWYTDNASMVADYNENVRYIRAAAGEMPLSGGNYTVDLMGQNVTFTGSGSVTCFDSSNDDFAGYGTATFQGATLANATFTTVEDKTYYAAEEAGAYSFHRLDARICGVSLRPSADGIYYTGIWNCDEVLAAKIDSYGVAVSLTAMPAENLEDSLYTAFAGETFQSGAKKTGVLIKGILKPDSADNEINGKLPVFAVPYVTVEGETSLGSGMGKSLYDVLTTFDENMGVYNTYAETLQSFLAKWENLSWDLAFAYNEDAAHLEQLYAGRTAYHGELHDHGNTGGTSDGNQTLAQWAANLKKLDMDFATIVDHKQLLHMDLADWDDTVFIGGTEPSTNITDSKATGKQMHYNMIFTDREAGEQVLKQFTEFKFQEDENGEWHFSYPNFKIARFQELIQAVKDAGGMFVFVHPKDGKRFISDDPLDYWFADYTGLEVFYVSKTDSRTKNNYKLWTDLLAAGKRVWATAGYDGHGVASVNTLTTIYADSKTAESYLNYAKVGDFSTGGIGIRMVVGDTRMGGATDFAGSRVVFCVSDFHSSQYDPTHTYRVTLLDDKGVVFEAEFDPTMPFYYAREADENAAFYRVEITDTTTGTLTAIGNPIWND